MTSPTWKADLPGNGSMALRLFDPFESNQAVLSFSIPGAEPFRVVMPESAVEELSLALRRTLLHMRRPADPPR